VVSNRTSGTHTKKGRISSRILSPVRNTLELGTQIYLRSKEERHGKNILSSITTEELRRKSLDTSDRSPEALASSACGRAKRVKVNNPDPGLDTKMELPSSPRYCGISKTSATSSNDRSEDWGSPSEKSPASDFTYSDPDDMVFLDNSRSPTRDPKDQKGKRKRVADGLVPHYIPSFGGGYSN
jgi:hypothetical protein